MSKKDVGKANGKVNLGNPNANTPRWPITSRAHFYPGLYTLAKLT